MMNLSSIGLTNCQGLSNFIMQSDMNTTKVLKDFEEYLKLGYGAENAIQEALEKNSLKKVDFTGTDWITIKRIVEQAAAARRY